jgi:hypothetical protein
LLTDTGHTPVCETIEKRSASASPKVPRLSKVCTASSVEEGSHRLIAFGTLVLECAPPMPGLAGPLPETQESAMSVAKKAKHGAKSIKGKTKKGAGKAKHKGKKAKNAAKH